MWPSNVLRLGGRGTRVVSLGTSGAAGPSDPAQSRSLPGELLDPGGRAFPEMNELPVPEHGAALTVNGKPARGCIGPPFRVEVIPRLKTGENVFEIRPCAPRSARLAFY